MSEDCTHREALAALPDAELAVLKQLSDGPGLIHLALHAGLLMLTGTAVVLAPTWPWLLVAMTVHGIALVFLFSLEHETIHGTAFRTPWLNAALAEIAGFLLLLPPRYFRYFHFAHHRHTQDPAHDPELARPRPVDWPTYLLRLSGLPYWKSQVSVLVSNALGRSYPQFVPPGGRAKLTVEARLHLLVMAALAISSIVFGWTWVVKLWILPALLGQPFLRAYLLAEHGGCPLVEDMLANSRITFTNRLVRFLAWNMPYHSAHHALPVIPFHRLPELTDRLGAHFKVTAKGYPEAHRQIRASWRDDGRSPIRHPGESGDPLLTEHEYFR